MKIIALGHKSRVGKDEFAKFIKDVAMSKYPKSRIKVAGFADKLKEVCHLLYGHIGVRDAHHYELNPADRDIVLTPDGKTVVDIWIDFGNKCREYDQDVWINPLFNEANCDVLIIKDLRFFNEAAKTKARGGILLKMTRLGVVGRESVSDNEMNEYDGWDDVLTNDAGLIELYALAKRIAKKYLEV